MAHPKFLFDRSFDLDGPSTKGAKDTEQEEEEVEEEEPEFIPPSFSEEELEAAKTEAFEKGKEQGLRDASDTLENQLLDATKTITQQVTQLLDHQQLANSDIFRDAVKIAQAITHKSFPNINAEHGVTEIEDIIYKLLPQILAEPRVVVHVHPDISETLSQRVGQIAKDAHFEGRMIITEDESIEAGNCKVEWSNGGAERNLDEIMQEIDTAIDNNLASPDSKYVPSPDALDDPIMRPNPASQTETGESLSEKPQEPEQKVSNPAESSAPEPHQEQAQEPPLEPMESAENTPDTNSEAPIPEPEKDHNSAINPGPQTDTESLDSPPQDAPEGDVKTTERENSQTNTAEDV